MSILRVMYNIRVSASRMLLIVLVSCVFLNRDVSGDTYILKESHPLFSFEKAVVLSRNDIDQFIAEAIASYSETPSLENAFCLVRACYQKYINVFRKRSESKSNVWSEQELQELDVVRKLFSKWALDAYRRYPMVPVMCELYGDSLRALAPANPDGAALHYKALLLGRESFSLYSKLMTDLDSLSLHMSFARTQPGFETVDSWCFLASPGLKTPSNDDIEALKALSLWFGDKAASLDSTGSSGFREKYNRIRERNKNLDDMIDRMATGQVYLARLLVKYTEYECRHTSAGTSNSATPSGEAGLLMPFMEASSILRTLQAAPNSYVELELVIAAALPLLQPSEHILTYGRIAKELGQEEADIVDCFFAVVKQSSNTGALEDRVDKLRKRYPGDDRLPMLQAHVAIKRGKLDHAKNILNAVIAANPENLRAKAMRKRFVDDMERRESQ